MLRMVGRGPGSHGSQRGPPRCPICRQVVHSLLQVGMPTVFKKSLSSASVKASKKHIQIDLDSPTGDTRDVSSLSAAEIEDVINT